MAHVPRAGGIPQPNELDELENHETKWEKGGLKPGKPAKLYEQVGGNILAKSLGNITASSCFVEQESDKRLEMSPSVQVLVWGRLQRLQ